MISDRHIATYQAGQGRITHALEVWATEYNTVGECRCGWFIESTGTDHASKTHVTRRYDTHAEETA